MTPARLLALVSLLAAVATASPAAASGRAGGDLPRDHAPPCADLAPCVDTAQRATTSDAERDALRRHDDAPDTISAARVRYTVAPGDTLGAIAKKYGVSVKDLRRWNKLDGDFLRIGQVLVVETKRGASPERRQFTYQVKKGDTAGAIAKRHRVSLRDLSRWNPRLDLNRLRIGQRLNLYAEGAAGSYGGDGRGRLQGAVQLVDGPGYRIRNPGRSWGTQTTVDAIRLGYARVHARFIDVPRVIVADLSFEKGGYMPPHRSHRTGWDVDATYYTIGETDECSWRSVDPDELDVRLQWYLFRSWLDQGLVEYIFVDFRLQKPLWEYARARGASEEQLAEWFEYPNRGSRGIIRHEPGHRDHYHARFTQPRD